MPIPIHLAVGWLMVLVTLGLVGFWVPPSEEVIGESYLIFFFHFPSAINCLNLFLLAGVFSGLYLVRKKPDLDLLGAAGVEVGLLATAVTLVTGSIWARAAWGVWWAVDDPRLMSVAIMFLTYLGYWALRSSLEEPLKRAQFCAVFGVIAAVNVPVVYYAIRVFGQSNHPMEVVMDELSMKATRWFGALSFLILYTALWRMKFRVLRAREATRRLEERFAEASI